MSAGTRPEPKARKPKAKGEEKKPRAAKSAVGYKWRHGGRGGVSVEVAAKAVERLERRFGVCHPKALVDEARPPDSPLHPLFDWNNETAGEAHRIHQARSIIRSISIVREPDGPPRVAFVHIDRVSDEGVASGYVRLVEGGGDAGVQAQVLRDALRQIRGWRRRYKDLESCVSIRPVFEAIDGIDLEEDDVA